MTALAERTSPAWTDPFVLTMKPDERFKTLAIRARVKAKTILAALGCANIVVAAESN